MSLHVMSSHQMDESFSINIDNDNEVRKNSNDKKLEGVNLNNRLGFDINVKIFVTKNFTIHGHS